MTSERTKRLQRRLDGLTHPLDVRVLNRGLKDWLLAPASDDFVNAEEAGRIIITDKRNG